MLSLSVSLPAGVSSVCSLASLPRSLARFEAINAAITSGIGVDVAPPPVPGTTTVKLRFWRASCEIHIQKRVVERLIAAQLMNALLIGAALALVPCGLFKCDENWASHQTSVALNWLLRGAP